MIDKQLMINPILALKIGLNEAIALQQIHYWVESSTKMIRGRKWIFYNCKKLKQQFPFWSEITIKQTIDSLKDQGLIVIRNFNHFKADKSKWDTIDYERIEALEDQNDGMSVPADESFDGEETYL